MKKKIKKGNPNTVKVEISKLTEDYIKIYGKHVIEERAVPDFRDGLKPVQRRILWAMHGLKLYHNKPYKKSANVVGDTLGNYHPHGDASIYDACVNMVNARYPLIQGYGNFGDLSTKAAASRYTEMRLTKLAEHMLSCHEVGIFTKNYTGELKEPIVIPSRLPYLLMNGYEGIAVGISGSIPSHNLGELLEGLKYILKTKKPRIDGLMDHIHGPDYLYGGWLLSTKEELKEVYRTGHGKIDYSCSYKYETSQDGNILIIVDSFCPRFDPAVFLERDMQGLLDKGLIIDAQDNSSEKNGTRLVIEVNNWHVFKNEVKPKLEKSVTYQFYTTERSEDDVEVSYSNLLEILEEFIAYQRTVETKMLKLDLKRTRESLFKEQVRLIAMLNIDTIAEALKKKTEKECEDYLIANVTKLQEIFKKNPDKAIKSVNEILEYKLRSLRRLNETSIRDTIRNLLKEIKRIKKDLLNIDAVVLGKLEEAKQFADERRTKLPGQYKRPSESKAGSEGEETICGLTPDGKLIKGVTSKGSSQLYKMFASTYQGVTITCKSGWTGQWDLGDIGGNIGKSFLDPVGMIPVEAPYALYQDANSRFQLIENPQKADEYQAMKSDTDIIGLHAVYPKAQILFWGQKKQFHSIPLEKLIKNNKVKRRNSKGHLMTPFRTVEDILVLNNGCELINTNGKIVSIEDAVNVQTDVYAVGDKNFILFPSGMKKVLDRDKTIKAIKKGVEVCIPLYFKAKKMV